MVFAGVSLVSQPAVAAAGINKTVNFQGKVTATSGLNVANGTYSFTFKIYGAATGGTAVWTETKNLTVTDGVFQTQLGDTTALPGSVDFNSDSIYMGITFNGDPEMSPRIQFTAAAYAFNSDKLGGLSASQFARTDANNVLTGTQTVKSDSTAALSIQNAAGNQTMLNLDASTATLTVGSASTAGKLAVTAGNGFAATFTPAALTASRTLTLPDASGTVCLTTTCVAGTAANFIQNTTTQQATSNFNISGTGVAATGFQAPALDTNVAGALALGITNATSITLGQNVNVSAGKSVSLTGSSAAGTVLSAQVSADTNARFIIGADGKLNWGSGTAATDTTLSRSGVAALTTNAGITAAQLSLASASFASTAKLYVQTSGNTTPTVVVRTSSTQTTDLLQLQDNAGNVASAFGANGQLTLGRIATTGTTIAGSLTLSDGTNSGFGAAINTTSPLTANRTISLGDESGIVCLRNSANCGFLTAAGSYINNGTSLQVANFNIQSTTTTSVTAVLRAVSGQTADLLQMQDSTGNTVLTSFNANGGLTQSSASTTNVMMGYLGLGTSNPQSLLTIANNGWITGIDSAGTGVVNMFRLTTGNEIQVGAALNTDGGIVLPTDAGQVALVDSPISSTSATGTVSSYTFRVGATNAMTVYGESNGASLAQNVRVAIGSSITPSYPLDVTGDINSSTQLRVAGTVVCTATGCTPASGSNNYIQNQTATGQAAGFNITGNGTLAALSATSGTFSAALQGTSGSFSTTLSATTSVSSAAFESAAASTTLTVGTTANTAGITIGRSGITTATAGNLSVTGSTSLSTTGIGIAAASAAALKIQAPSGTGNGILLWSRGANTSDVLRIATQNNDQLASFSYQGYLTLGNSSSGYQQTGTLKLQDGIASGFATTLSPTTLTAARTLTAPDESGVLCVQSSANCGFIVGSASNFIQNTTSQQATSNFNISGAGVAGTGLTAPLFQSADSNSANTGAVTIRSGNASGSSNLNSGNVTVDAGTKAASGFAGNVYLGTTNAANVQVGRAGAVLTVQGSSSSTLAFTNAAGTFTTTLGFTTPTANNAINFPNAGGTVCTTVASTCSSVYQATGAYIAKNAADTTTASTTGAVLGISNTGTGAGSALLLANAGTNSALTITQSSNPSSGQAMVFGNLTASSPTGNLIDLQTGGTSQFAVTAAGAVSTTGAINGQTISSAANFTGTLQTAAAVTVQAGGLTVNAGGINVSGASSITGTLSTTAKLTVSSGGAAITGTVAVTGAITATGDILLDQTGSTQSVPRTLSFGANATGTASRVALNSNTGIQTANGQRQQLYSYWGVDIAGNRQTGTLPSFVGGASTDASLRVLGGQAGAPVQILQAASGQSADTFRIINNAGDTVMAKFDASGNLTIPTANATTGFQINGAATTGTFLRGNGTNYVASALQSGDIVAGSANYIQNTTTQQQANQTIKSAFTGSAVAVFQGATGQTADLIDVKTESGTNALAVAAGGAITTSSTINGQTISNAASFTGTVTAATGLTVTTGGIAVTGNSTITGTLGVSAALTASNGLTVSAGGASITGGINNNAGGITGAGAIAGATGLTFSSAAAIDSSGATALTIGTSNTTGVTIGKTAGSLVLQGAAANTTLSGTANGFTASLGFSTPTATVAYKFDGSTTAGTYQICTTYASTCGTTYAAYSSTGYIQMAPATAQTDSSTNSSIFINKTATSGNLLRLQNSASDVFVVQSNGALTQSNTASLAGGVMTVDASQLKVRIGSGTPTLGNGTLANSALYVTGSAEFAGQIQFGDATNNTAINASTKELTLNGTARHTKTLRLTPEYAGAVLDASGTNNNGTMTAAFDATQRMGYYRWTTSQATAQNYDVVVNVPVPDDWSAWNGNPTFKMYQTNTACIINATIIRTDGTTDTGFNNLAILGSGSGATGSWLTYNSTALNTTGYTAGGVMTIRIRLTAPTSQDVRIGDITLPYYSRY